MLDEILSGLRKIPVYVLTGFLGTGKTSLLKRLVTEGGLEDAAILINEFGDFGIDDMLVRQVNEHTVLLNSGCICCSVRADLLEALRELFALKLEDVGFPFTRVIIETSGATDPIPVIHTLNTDPFLQERFCLEGVISTLDITAPEGDLFRHEEALRQVALADWIVVTKADLVEGDRQAKLKDLLRSVNPDARVISTESFDVKALAAAIRAGSIATTTHWQRNLSDMTERLADARKASGLARRGFLEKWASTSHPSPMESFLLEAEEPLDWSDLNGWIENLLMGKSEAILRLKGVVTLKDQNRRAVVQGVRQVFYPVSWLDASSRPREPTRIVLIVENREGASRQRLMERTLPQQGVLSDILLPV